MTGNAVFLKAFFSKSGWTLWLVEKNIVDFAMARISHHKQVMNAYRNNLSLYENLTDCLKVGPKIAKRSTKKTVSGIFVFEN